MRYFKLAIPVLMMVLVISCGNMNKNRDGDDQKTSGQFKSAEDAANAAKEDMLDAMDKVNFGINREQLKSSKPGAPLSRYNVDWNSLLKADSGTVPENMVEPEAVTVVPLINGNNVVTIISLKSKDQHYTIAALGDKQVSSELDIVRKADSIGMQNEIRIYEIPNLEAIIYDVIKGSRSTYYTSYNNNSLRQAIPVSTLVQILKEDAQKFQRTYGDEMKKGRLVK